VLRMSYRALRVLEHEALIDANAHFSEAKHHYRGAGFVEVDPSTTNRMRTNRFEKDLRTSYLQ
jgi:hypothetical protein